MGGAKGSGNPQKWSKWRKTGCEEDQSLGCETLSGFKTPQSQEGSWSSP